MQSTRLSRRAALSRTGLLAASVTGLGVTRDTHAAPSSVTENAKPLPAFTYCLNTGTIRGQKLGIVKEVEIAAKAGYRGIEPWVSDIGRYAEEGGSLEDLRKRIDDLGLTVESAIAFSQWISDDEARRAKAFDQTKREMDLVAQMGGRRIAAPPAGATKEPGLDLLQAAARYRALLELGEEMGVVPQLELWGFSANLHLLGEAAFILIEAGHPQAALMPDTFHVYKGGSSLSGLRFFGSTAIQVYHMNDYPAEPSRDKVNDSHRVMPGDGVAPTSRILRDLEASGGRKVLSLELFNRDYWRQDALAVAELGLRKMREAVARAKTP